MRDERGQIMPLAALGLLVVLIGISGFVVDVGQGLWAKRQLQSAADAAALAAARDLPDATAVNTAANRYGPGSTGLNAARGMTNVTTTVTTKCLNRTPGCAAPNAVAVQATGQVNTVFSRIFGLNSFTVKANATACAPCGNNKRPLDVMFVIDRTGSMCQTHSGANDPACTDLANARAGMKSFLQLMDPATDHVGLVLFPPAPSVSARCNAPTSYGSGEYVVSPLPTASNGVRSDYLTNGQINNSSSLIQTINCIQGSGSTSYSAALGEAALELYNHGRSTSDVPNLEKVIVFMSDGAANTRSQSWLDSSSYADAPCHQGIYVSDLIEQYVQYPVYSIGYDVNPTDDGSERCKNPSTGGNESPTITAYDALRQIATTPDKFHLANQIQDSAQLRSIFSSIAADTKRGTSSLVDDNA